MIQDAINIIDSQLAHSTVQRQNRSQSEEDTGIYNKRKNVIKFPSFQSMT